MTKKEKKADKKSSARVVRVWHKTTQPVVRRVKGLLARRPHRSFRVTKRRDYKRSFKLPGYWAFTNLVRATLWKNWKLFGGLVLVYVIITIVISGFGAQQSYSNLSTALKQTSGDLFKGNFGTVSQAGLLLLTAVTTGLTPDVTQAQTVLTSLAGFFGWLTTIWLVRNTLAGHKPRLRDGLYNSGSPVLATALIGFIIVLQLLPAAIALIIYSAAQASGIMDTGVTAMLVWGAIILLSLVSLYWITSSFIAMVIVTLPGMYPMQAIKTAGDLVVGRRVRILFRLIWLALLVVVAWVLIMIPIILFDDWIKKVIPAITWAPIVPLAILTMASVTLVFVTTYIYLLYRRIVDDDAPPA